MAVAKKNILIAEDESSLARALELKLNKLDYQVVIVSNGEEAVNQLSTNKFNIVLLDLIMPRLDGFGVLEKLKALKIKVPVIVCSNLGQAEDLKRAKELGAMDYLVKSDTPINGIVDRIKKFIK